MLKKFNWLALILGLYIVTRFWGLAAFPLFTDEVYYVRLVREGTGLWTSFTDGKEPLFFWVLALVTRYASDPVIAGRLFSVFAGLGTLILIYLLGKKLFSRKAGLVAATFYLFSPFALIYNRLSLVDGLLVLLLSGFVYGLFEKRVLAAGIFYGLALITKTISQIFVFFIPLAVWLVSGNRKVLLVVVVAAAFYLPVVLAPGFSAIAQKNLTFAYPPDYSLAHLQETLLPNLKMSLKDWLMIYLGLLPLLGVFAAGVYGVVRKNPAAIFLGIAFLFPLFAESFVARTFFPRYLLFLTIPGFLLNAYLISRIKAKLLLALVLIVFLLQPFHLFWQIEWQPKEASLPAIEKWQLFDGWPSELKAETAINNIEKLAGNKQIVVATESYGVGEFIKYRFYSNPNVSIRIITDRSAKIEADYVALNE